MVEGVHEGGEVTTHEHAELTRDGLLAQNDAYEGNAVVAVLVVAV